MFKGCSSVVLSGIALGIACSGAEAPPNNGAANATSAAQIAAEAETQCVASFQRQRDCTDTFLPALVDLRIRLDRPAGIADAARTEGRDALLAAAREEWREDSTDDSIVNTCKRMSANGKVSAAMNAQISACVGSATCKEFVPCQMHIIEEHLVSQ